MSPATLDKAFNTGTYKDFPGLFEGTQVPTQGWWELILDGSSSKVVYHFFFANGSIEPVYELRYSEKEDGRDTKDEGELLEGFSLAQTKVIARIYVDNNQ